MSGWITSFLSWVVEETIYISCALWGAARALYCHDTRVLVPPSVGLKSSSEVISTKIIIKRTSGLHRTRFNGSSIDDSLRPMKNTF